jgi:hypothetical protein
MQWGGSWGRRGGGWGTGVDVHGGDEVHPKQRFLAQKEFDYLVA